MFERFKRLHAWPWPADPRDQLVPDVTGPYYASSDDQARYFERMHGSNARVCDRHVHSFNTPCENGLSTLGYLRLRKGGACDHPIGYVKDHWWSKPYCLLCGQARSSAVTDWNAK